MEFWTFVLCMWALVLSAFFLGYAARARTDLRKMWKVNRCRDAEIFLLNGTIDDAKKRLNGFSQSVLDGEGGLAAATMRDNLRLVATADALSEKVAELSKPDWFWDDNCSENAASSIESVVCEGDFGEVIKLRPVHDLPPIFVVHDDTGYEVFHTEDEADKAAEKWNAK